MKKYITPTAKYINVSSEGFLAGSGDPDGFNNEVTDAPSLSNRRSIWGDED